MINLSYLIIHRDDNLKSIQNTFKDLIGSLLGGGTPGARGGTPGMNMNIQGGINTIHGNVNGNMNTGHMDGGDMNQNIGRK